MTDNLIDRIREANSSYRSGNPIMPDSEYDSLVDELKSSIGNDEFIAIMEGMNEGAVEDSSKKVSHPFIMGSLHKLKYEEPKSVAKFVHGKIKGTMSVSAKIDGISCRLHYENGTLTQASTRGNGKVGQDISDKIRFVKFVPQHISNIETVDIRGELVILKEDFLGMDGFANPRNACAGIMNRKDFSTEELSGISFIAYTILGERYTKSEQFSVLESNGFKTAWHIEVDKDDIAADDVNLVDRLFWFATQDFEYDTDGLVLCGTDYRNEKSYYPDNCAAFKLNQLIAKTKLIDIEWQGPSKDGRIIPVAVLEPVSLGGSMIGKATLHNNDFIREKGISYGSTIELIKGGDIIPKVVKVLSNENTSPIEFPSVCRCCGTRLVERDHWFFCPNENCKDQTTYQVQHFLEKLGIENVSFKRLNQLGISTVEELLAFAPNESRKIEKKLYSDLKSKLFSRSRKDILSALNFEGISTKTLGKIFDHYGFDDAVKHDNLRGYPMGVGEKTMEKFLQTVDRNMETVNKITSDARYSYAGDSETENHLSSAAVIGTICFTGSLNSMGRKEASILAERNGFEVKNSVTKGLTYLVTNNADSGSTKAKKAMEQGTTVIDEEQFLKLVQSNGMNVDDL